MKYYYKHIHPINTFNLPASYHTYILSTFTSYQHYILSTLHTINTTSYHTYILSTLHPINRPINRTFTSEQRKRDQTVSVGAAGMIDRIVTPRSTLI